MTAIILKLLYFMKLLLIIISQFIFQNNLTSQNLHKYYQHINNAEIAIVNSDFAKASLLYDSAFKNKLYPFSQDLYNASLVNIYEHKYYESMNRIRKMISLGYKPSNYLNNLKSCKKFMKSKFGDSVKILEKKTQFIYNNDYRAKIEGLCEYDQEFRNKEGSYKKYGDTIRKIDEIIANDFLKLIEKFGFPSEDKIGLDSHNIIFPIYAVLIIHQQNGANFRTTNYADILKMACLKGEIRNNIAGNFIDAANGFTSYETSGYVMATYDSIIKPKRNYNKINESKIKLSTKLGILKLNDNEIQKYNSNRKELMLVPIEEEIKKLKFCLVNKDFLLGATTRKSVYNVTTYEQFLHIKNNLIY